MAHLSNNTLKNQGRLKLIAQKKENKAKGTTREKMRTGMARQDGQNGLEKDRKQDGEGGLADK